MPSQHEDEFSISDFKALKVEMSNLNTNMQRLSGIIELNTRQLSKIEVLEVNHNHQSQGLDRAFTAIKEFNQKIDDHEKSDVVAHDTIAKAITTHAEQNRKEHKAYDKYIYMSIGFVTAVCLFWTLFGARMNATIDENVKSIAELKANMQIEQAISTREKAKTQPNGNGG